MLLLLVTVEVKLVISEAKAVSAFALVVCSVAMAEVFEFTVDVKLVKEDAVAFCALVTVTMSPCAVAIAAVKVLPVKLVLPNSVTRVASRPATQALFAEFLVYI